MMQAQSLAVAADAVSQGSALAAQLAVEANSLAAVGLAQCLGPSLCRSSNRPTDTQLDITSLSGARRGTPTPSLIHLERRWTARVWEAAALRPQTLAHDGGSLARRGTPTSLILTWSATMGRRASGRQERPPTLAHDDGSVGRGAWNAEPDSPGATMGRRASGRRGSDTPRQTLAHDDGSGSLARRGTPTRASFSPGAAMDGARLGRQRHARQTLHYHQVDGATWNADESLILTWSGDGTARVWEAGSDTPRRQTLAHDGWVIGATWNADESPFSPERRWTARLGGGQRRPWQTLAHDRFRSMA